MRIVNAADGHGGWGRQSTTAPPLCPQHCGPFTAVQVALDQSIYRPLAPLSLSLSISADDEAYALDHGYANSTSPLRVCLHTCLNESLRRTAATSFFINRPLRAKANGYYYKISASR